VNQYRHLHLSGATGGLRAASFQERDYLVVPVTALMEGVIWPSNASGPEFVPASALSALGWDGRPVMRGHPSKDGVDVSANDPRVLESGAFGTVFNTTVKDGRLLMEAWLDPQRAASVSDADRIIERLRNNETVEVSIGAFVVMERRAGQHLLQSYDVVWRDIMPDHLAFLVEGQTGACSVAMGCGAQRHLVTAQGITRLTDACSCARERTTHMQNGPNAPTPTHDDLRDLILLNRDATARIDRAERELYKSEMARFASARDGEAAPPPIDLNARIRALRGVK
jgi:hypothetical protein